MREVFSRRTLIGAFFGIAVTLSLLFLYIRLRPASQSVVDTIVFPDATATASSSPASLSVLTGEPIPVDGFFSISVMLDNSVDIPVRYGLEGAAIVYEAPVEGGLTRLMAVFPSYTNVERIGPVRSLRPYFIDWATEYGGILMHVGGSPQALAKARTVDHTRVIDQIGAYESYFERASLYDAPHNVFTSAISWRKIADRSIIATTSPTTWRFASPTTATQTDGASVQLEIEYSSLYSAGWVFDFELNAWLRFVNGNREKDSTGNQVRATNVVVAEVDGDVIDSVGRWKFDTIGSGAARVYTEGREISARWLKASAGSRIRFVDDNQNEISLQPGSTWIAVVPTLEVAEFKRIERER